MNKFFIAIFFSLTAFLFQISQKPTIAVEGIKKLKKLKKLILKTQKKQNLTKFKAGSTCL